MKLNHTLTLPPTASRAQCFDLFPTLLGATGFSLCRPNINSKKPETTYSFRLCNNDITSRSVCLSFHTCITFSYFPSLILPRCHSLSLLLKKEVAIYSSWIMRGWLPPFSPRLTELTSGLFGRLVGKPLQCCSRCRQGRPSTHRWRHTYTHTRAGTYTHIQCTRPKHPHLHRAHYTHERGCVCIRAYRCEHKYRCERS